MAKDNGLELQSVKTEAVSIKRLEFDEFDSFKSTVGDYFGKQNGFCVFYLDYKVLIGKYVDENFRFYNNELFKPQYIQKMRLFNGDYELYIWRRSDGEFAGRLRIDGKGTDTDVVDAWQILWGTQMEHLGEFSKIYEERGTKLIVPFKDITVDNGKNRVFLHTRNYIGHNEYGQAGYEDCRFINFTDKNKQNLGG